MNGVIGSVFEADSLRNIDVDEDDRADGFTFRIKNPIYKVFELTGNQNMYPVIIVGSS